MTEERIPKRIFQCNQMEEGQGKGGCTVSKRTPAEGSAHMGKNKWQTTGALCGL